MEKIIKHLFDKLDVKYTQKLDAYCDQAKNLADISQVCDLYKLSNIAITLTPERLSEIPYPAIIQSEGRKYWVLEEFKDNLLHLHDGKKSIIKSQDEFFKFGDVPTILFIKDENSGEIDYKSNQAFFNKSKIQLGLVAASIIGILILLLLQLSPISLLNSLLLVTNFIGLSISILLLSKEYNSLPNWADKLCNVNQKTDCSKVIHSKEAKLFGWLSWTDIGLVYFGGNILILLLNQNSGIQLISFLTLLSLPFTIYSLYFQFVKIKKLCTLCLATLVVLWLNFIIFYGFNQINIELLSKFSIKNTAVLFTNYLIAITFLGLLRLYLDASTERRFLSSKLALWQTNSDLFLAMLDAKSKHYIQFWDDEIIQGDASAPINLTVVSNPYCEPCAKTHEIVHELSEYFADEINISYRFQADYSDNIKNEVIKYLLSLPSENQLEAINFWYKTKDFTKLQNEFKSNKKDISKIFNNHVEWASQAEINHTPTLFLNGTRIDLPYNAESLPLHLRSLVERMENVNS